MWSQQMRLSVAGQAASVPGIGVTPWARIATISASMRLMRARDDRRFPRVRSWVKRSRRSADRGHKIQRPPIFTPLGERPWNPSSALVMCTGRAARVAGVNMGYLVRAPPGGAADCGLMNGLVKP